MARVLVDANVVIAARLGRDSNHDRGKTLVDAFDHGALPRAFLISDVLEEIYNYLQARAGHETATTTLDALIESSGFEIAFTPKAAFDTARSLARTYEQLSLTDAVIVAFMRRRDIEYLYSFDDGFDGLDSVTRFVTPENPLDPS
jgi:predicted nucleic acid-binding protein